MKTVTENSDTPHSASGSGRVPQVIFGFLAGVPDAARIGSIALLVASTDDKVVRRWQGERADYCRDLPGGLFGLPHMSQVRVFRPPPTATSSRVLINGLEWWQTKWPGIPTTSEHIHSLVIRTTNHALFFVPSVIPVQHQNSRGNWNTLPVSELRENEIWLHVNKEVHKWQVKIQLEFLPEDGGSTTALVQTRKAA